MRKNICHILQGIVSILAVFSCSLLSSCAVVKNAVTAQQYHQFNGNNVIAVLDTQPYHRDSNKPGITGKLIYLHEDNSLTVRPVGYMYLQQPVWNSDGLHYADVDADYQENIGVGVEKTKLKKTYYQTASVETLQNGVVDFFDAGFGTQDGGDNTVQVAYTLNGERQMSEVNSQAIYSVGNCNGNIYGISRAEVYGEPTDFVIHRFSFAKKKMQHDTISVSGNLSGTVDSSRIYCSAGGIEFIFVSFDKSKDADEIQTVNIARFNTQTHKLSYTPLLTKVTLKKNAHGRVVDLQSFETGYQTDDGKIIFATIYGGMLYEIDLKHNIMKQISGIDGTPETVYDYSWNRNVVGKINVDDFDDLEKRTINLDIYSTKSTKKIKDISITPSKEIREQINSGYSPVNCEFALNPSIKG